MTKVFMVLATLTLIMMTACTPPAAYRGPKLPADQTATLRINPPMANIGVELVAVNDFPFLAEEDASLKAGRNTLHLNVWPTTQSDMQMTDPAFATMYSMQDTEYTRKVTITFDAQPSMTYGINGDFDMGYSPETASSEVQVFVIGTHEIVGRTSTRDNASTANDIVEGIKDTQGEDWSLKAAPGC
jgi:hypothetical protein